MRRYWIRVYDVADTLVEETRIVPESCCDDDDPWLALMHARDVECWSPAHRVEVQVDADGWSQALLKAPGSLSCGHKHRSYGRCVGAAWCSGVSA